jgi:hypothetical protein
LGKQFWERKEENGKERTITGRYKTGFKPDSILESLAFV